MEKIHKNYDNMHHIHIKYAWIWVKEDKNLSCKCVLSDWKGEILRENKIPSPT